LCDLVGTHRGRTLPPQRFVLRDRQHKWFRAVNCSKVVLT
jgi:hypothetical protein